MEQEAGQWLARGKPETSRGVYASKSFISGAEGFVPHWAGKEAGSEVHGGAGAVSGRAIPVRMQLSEQ